jgi:hypothetical protein
MSQINTIETTAWKVRINYDDGDVKDIKMRGDPSANAEARDASLTLRATCDVIHGSTTTASYRNGKDTLE